MTKQDHNFCLSGLSKPFSKKQENTNDKKTKDATFKQKSIKSSHTDGQTERDRERPKTAVKKPSVMRGSSLSWSRPGSANTKVKYGRAKLRFPGLKSTQSIDSAVSLSSQHSSSSTEDDKSSEEEEDRNEDSHGPSTSEEDEDCSEDSGIIKVRMVSRSSSSEDKVGEDMDRSSPRVGPILVKEFNSTPDMMEAEQDAVEEILDIAPDESEDEESRLEPPPAAPAATCSGATSQTQPEDLDLTLQVQTDVRLVEVGPDENSAIIAGLHGSCSNVEVKTANTGGLRISDIECTNSELELYDKIQDNFTRIETAQNSENYNHENYQCSAVELYQPEGIDQKNSQNSSLLELVQSGTENRTYEQLIESTIMKLEKEEVTTSNEDSEIQTKKTLTKHDETDKAEKARLSEAELENLKQKCISRLKTQQSKELVTNPPILKEFSNSQKLLNFLDEAEEKDKTILNSVKRSSYNLQVSQQLSPQRPLSSSLLTRREIGKLGEFTRDNKGIINAKYFCKNIKNPV